MVLVVFFLFVRVFFWGVCGGFLGFFNGFLKSLKNTMLLPTDTYSFQQILPVPGKHFAKLRVIIFSNKVYVMSDDLAHL